MYLLESPQIKMAYCCNKPFFMKTLKINVKNNYYYHLYFLRVAPLIKYNIITY